jgi:hypothetical protein
MKRPRAIAFGVLGVILTIATTATPAHASGYGQGWYGVWATNVNVREGGDPTCDNYPSTTNCPNIRTTVSAPEQVWVYCQKAGQTIGGNPYWLIVVNANGVPGWMASYYTDNATNWIDGVPGC